MAKLEHLHIAVAIVRLGIAAFEAVRLNIVASLVARPHIAQEGVQEEVDQEGVGQVGRGVRRAHEHQEGRQWGCC